jgi:FkbM family methyltransferase
MMGDMRQVTLTDGTRIACLQRTEALVLDHHVAGYFAHGVRVPAHGMVVDVGANVGVFAVRALQRAPGVRVLAFEPIPEICQVLRSNAERHGDGRLHVFDCGVSDREGEATFTYFPRSPALSTAHPEMWEEGEVDGFALAVSGTLRNAPPSLWWSRWVPTSMSGLLAGYLRGRSQRVHCVLRPLSDVFREQGVSEVDLLKIDCEGGELGVLQGIDEVHWPGIHQVVVEVHDRHGRLDEVVRLLRERGLQRLQVETEAGFEETVMHNVYASRAGGSDP